MKVTPKSEQDFQNMKIMEPGEYNFTISEAFETISKAGNEMIEVKLKIINNNGKIFTLTDYLIDSDSMGHKIRHLWDSLDLIDKYETGYINPHDIKNKKGKAKIGIRKDKEGKYPDKNVVIDYLISKNLKSNNFIDDSLPF